MIEKEPCGEDVTGIVDLTDSANQFGDYESKAYDYEIDNSFDDIYMNIEYEYSKYHGSNYQYKILKLSYDTLENYNGRTFYIDLDYRPETVHNLWVYWKANRTRMPYCYDLPYYMLFGNLPPVNQDANITKKELYQKLIASDYKLRDEGALNSSVYIKDGDIIIFGINNPPDPENAPHYAVVIDNVIWQIIPWTPDGGEFDGPRDMSFFLNRPKMINPYTGKELDPPYPYLYYKIYNK